MQLFIFLEVKCLETTRRKISSKCAIQFSSKQAQRGHRPQCPNVHEKQVRPAGQCPVLYRDDLVVVLHADCPCVTPCHGKIDQTMMMCVSGSPNPLLLRPRLERPEVGVSVMTVVRYFWPSLVCRTLRVTFLMAELGRTTTDDWS